jgi:hypothetical protein
MKCSDWLGQRYRCETSRRPTSASCAARPKGDRHLSMVDGDGTARQDTLWRLSRSTLYDCIRRFVRDHSFTLTTRVTRVQQDGRLARQALARGSSGARAGQTDPTDGVGTPPLPTVGSACGGAVPANAARRRADSVEGGRRPASAGVRDREAPFGSPTPYSKDYASMRRIPQARDAAPHKEPSVS